MSLKVFAAAMMITSQVHSHRFPRPLRPRRRLQQYGSGQSSQFQSMKLNGNGVHSKQKAFRYVSRTDKDGNTEIDEDLYRGEDGKVVKEEHEHISNDQVTKHTAVVDGSQENESDELEKMAEEMKKMEFPFQHIMKEMQEMEKQIFKSFKKEQAAVQDTSDDEENKAD